MNQVVKEGFICVKEHEIEFRVCVIRHILNSDGTFEYVFIPNYSVISLLSVNVFQGIPGLNLDLKEKEYIRKNRIPTFISERVPSENREDFYEILEEVGMDYMDPIEYLIRTDKKYSGDDFYVIPYENKSTISIENSIHYKSNTHTTIKCLLNYIATGKTVIFGEEIIDDKNRKVIFNILLNLYLKSLLSNKEKQMKGIDKAKKAKKYKGRKPIKVDMMLFIEEFEKVNKGEQTSKEAANKLGISIDKYYRIRKKL